MEKNTVVLNESIHIKTPDIKKWKTPVPEESKLSQEPTLQDYLEDLKTYRRYKHWLSFLKLFMAIAFGAIILVVWQLWTFSFWEITRLTDRLSAVEASLSISREDKISDRLQELEKFKIWSEIRTQNNEKAIDKINYFLPTPSNKPLLDKAIQEN